MIGAKRFSREAKTEGRPPRPKDASVRPLYMAGVRAEIARRQRVLGDPSLILGTTTDGPTITCRYWVANSIIRIGWFVESGAAAIVMFGDSVNAQKTLATMGLLSRIGGPEFTGYPIDASMWSVATPYGGGRP